MPAKSARVFNPRWLKMAKQKGPSVKEPFRQDRHSWLSYQALGRLPWLAPFLRRARRLRPPLPISVLQISPISGFAR